MRNRFRSFLIALSCLAAVYLLDSCGPKGGSHHQSTVGSPQIQAPSAELPAPVADTSVGDSLPLPAFQQATKTAQEPQKNLSASAAGRSRSAMGTSDSGGGTGTNRKVFESFIVDPTSLPAYKQILKPLLDHIRSQDPGSSDPIFNLKTWYIAPVELEKIDKDVLGFSFIKSATRQTLTEVWIDKGVYDSMKPRDQAELLLHEMVMSLYFTQFVS